MKTHTPLYDQDFYVWTQQQAVLLRRKSGANLTMAIWQRSWRRWGNGTDGN